MNGSGCDRSVMLISLHPGVSYLSVRFRLTLFSVGWKADSSFFFLSSSFLYSFRWRLLDYTTLLKGAENEKLLSAGEGCGDQ